MRKQRRLNGPMLSAVASLARENWPAAEIERELKKRVENGDLVPPVPTPPTIRDIVKEWRPPDPSGPWSILDAQGDDAAIVLSVLKEAIVWSRGHVRGFTREEADALIKVAQAAPDLPIFYRWFLAREYVRRRLAGESAEDLEIMLAFGFWRSDHAERQYAGVKDLGWIPDVPIMPDDFEREAEEMTSALVSLMKQWDREEGAAKRKKGAKK